MNRILLAALVGCAAFAAVARAEVVALDPSNFDSVVDGSKHVLVEFYAPWCGHCKNLAPTYEELGAAYAHASKDVVIAKVDADAHRELGGRFGVSGFPTLKFFPKGSTRAIDYNSGRDLQSFIDFLSSQTGITGKVPFKKEYVVKLTDSNFDEIVGDANKHVLVEFFAPWCGHCKNLAPKYEKLAQTFSREQDVVIAAIDADNYKSIANRFGVQGFPTLKFFPKNNKDGIPYEGGREEADFITFLNRETGTFRVAGGGLNEQAGRSAALDALAADFIANPAERESILAKAKASTEKNAKIYVRAMEKILSGSADYVNNEIARLDRLRSGANIAGEKADEFAVRRNILSAFSA